MDSMSARFKTFGLRTKRDKNHHTSLPSHASSSSNTLVGVPSNTSASTSASTPTSSAPSARSSSTASLPMNQNTMGRPPSYSYGRSASPMPPGQQVAGHHPPALNTNMQYTTPSAQPVGAPPGYGMQPPLPPRMPPGVPQAPYPTAQNPAEVEGAGRSKTQLIVGIDFGTTFSGVAFAFATNNEAKEDIITEWPGAGTNTKQKVG